jgi:hypothetical protein
MAPHRRHFRLILPKLQWRLIGAMSAVAALALLVQYTLFVRCVLEIASSLPHDGDVLIAQSASTLGWVLVVSLAILFPILFFVAVAVSHRFCGPLYRFEKYLGAVVEGTERGECRLRTGDDLQELCGLINRATAAARASTLANNTAPAATRDAA